jgi:hypothetical protein
MPRFHDGNGGYRDHYAAACSIMLAGAGVARGKMVGSSDARGRS